MGIFLSREIATLCPNFCKSLWLANTKKVARPLNHASFQIRLEKFLKGKLKFFDHLEIIFTENIFYIGHTSPFAYAIPLLFFRKCNVTLLAEKCSTISSGGSRAVLEVFMSLTIHLSIPNEMSQGVIIVHPDHCQT